MRYSIGSASDGHHGRERLATLVNPYGFGAWTHVLGALHNPVTRKEMVDWQPLIPVIANSHGPHSGIFFFLLVAGI